MKRTVKSNNGIYGFLEASGVLETGTAEEISALRKRYWKEYKRLWRNNKRKNEKELTISFNSEELLVLTKAAKKTSFQQTQICENCCPCLY